MLCIISTALDVPKIFLLFYMCQLWALHSVIKRQFFYIYYTTEQCFTDSVSLSFNYTVITVVKAVDVRTFER